LIFFIVLALWNYSPRIDMSSHSDTLSWFWVNQYLRNIRKYYYRIGGVMVSVFASSAVDRGFESRSGQPKDYKIGICYFSARHTASRRKGKYWLTQIVLINPFHYWIPIITNSYRESTSSFFRSDQSVSIIPYTYITPNTTKF
jgi:hypothetical protein